VQAFFESAGRSLPDQQFGQRALLLLIEDVALLEQLLDDAQLLSCLQLRNGRARGLDGGRGPAGRKIPRGSCSRDARESAASRLQVHAEIRFPARAIAGAARRSA